MKTVTALPQVSLSQLLTTHVPTVWAIDQYRIYKEVSGVCCYVGNAGML